MLSICEDGDGNIWTGTWGQGLSVFDKGRNKFKHYTYDPADPNGLSSPNIWCLFEDADRNIWVGTYGGGLCKYDKKKDRFIRYENDPATAGSLSTTSAASNG